MDHLTPQDLFSPSKARQQRAQAADWAHIDSWLSHLYGGRSVPAFERNERTLDELRALAAANERADEERVIIERVERQASKEIAELEKSHHPSDANLIARLKTHLTPSGSQALKSLASTATLLNTPSADATALAHALIAHTRTVQTLTNDLSHISTLNDYLATQQTLLRAQLADLTSNPAYTAPSNLPRQTTDRSRQIKLLRARVRQHEDKLAALEGVAENESVSTLSLREVGSIKSMADMLEQQAKLEHMAGEVGELERKVAQFAGLPADREAARREVAKLEMELDTLRRRRDGLFGGLVEK